MTTTTFGMKHSDSKTNRQITLIMPCLDEAANLHILLPELLNTYQFRVIVCDNGSTDGSPTIAKSYGAEVTHAPKRGYGRAVLQGLQYLKSHSTRPATPSDIIVVFDADGTSPQSYIPAVISNIAANKADFVIGQRTELTRGSMPTHAKFGNWLQTFLIGLLTGYNYQDMGPLRAMTFAHFCALELEDQTWGFNVEMQIKAALNEYRLYEVPIQYRPRIHGKSKISGSLIGSIRAGSRILAAVGYYYIKAKWQLRASAREKKNAKDLGRKFA